MNTNIRLVILAILLLSLIMLGRQVKKRTLNLKHTLAWFFLILVMMIIDLFPDIIVFFSSLLGIELPSNMLFLFGYILLLVIIYTLTVAISKLSNEIRQMAQKMALMNKELEQLKEQKDTDKEQT